MATRKSPAKTTTPQAPPAPAAGSVLQVIERAATDPNVDIDKMERLLQMQKDIMAEQARHAFQQAMVAAQEQMRPVVRDAENNQTNSRFARLETIDRAIRPIYTQHGFSLSFGTEDCPLEGHIRVVCDVAHVDGHTATHRLDMPLDMHGIKGNANKTPTHARGSTLSYARRYLTLMVFNLAMADEDDDGNGAGDVPRVSATQAAQLKAKLERCPEYVRDWVATEYGDVEAVPEAHFTGLLDSLGQAAHQALLESLAEQVEAAQDADTLEKVWKDGLSAIKASRDMDAYHAFKERVQARGQLLRAQQPSQEAHDESH